MIGTRMQPCFGIGKHVIFAETCGGRSNATNSTLLSNIKRHIQPISEAVSWMAAKRSADPGSGAATFEPRRTHTTQATITGNGLYPADYSHVDARHAPVDYERSCAVVYREVVTEEEAGVLSKSVLERMRRRRYERGHWDSVISDYKEIELIDESFTSSEEIDSAGNGDGGTISISKIFRRIRYHLEQCHLQHKLQSILGERLDIHDKTGCATGEPGKPSHANYISWLPCHGIDLKVDGELNAHVDSVKFSGDLIAGLSLLSPSIMRLKPAGDDYIDEETAVGKDGDGAYRSKVSSNFDSKSQEENDEGWVDLYLPPRSLYALTGVGRYRYSHELLPTGSTFTLQGSCGDDNGNVLTTDMTTINNGRPTQITVDRSHRLSIIFRDAK